MAEVTSMLAYRMRQLGSRCTDAHELAEAVRQILDNERIMISDAHRDSGFVAAQPAQARVIPVVSQLRVV
jgi:hypothetical protein